MCQGDETVSDEDNRSTDVLYQLISSNHLPSSVGTVEIVSTLYSCIKF